MDIIEKFKVAIVIPTYNDLRATSRLLASLENLDDRVDIYCVDSSSKDGTYEFLKNNKKIKELVSISSSLFNHGKTRQMMVEKYNNYDIYVFLTQDAYPVAVSDIYEIVKFFSNDKVGAVCGRQLPHLDADPFASHARYFNYPDITSTKGIMDIPKLGIKVPFLSNSFTAYRKKALDESGGFPSDVILSEDMYVGAKMVLKGWEIGYSAEARVYHSHNYSIPQEFRRYFDIGVFHSREPWIQNRFGGAGGAGFDFVRSELKYLKGRNFLKLISIIRNFFKLFAYKLGKNEKLIPVFIKKRISMHRKYWS